MDFSPALSVTSDMTDEELDKYFASYVPLSNLPTPPPAKEHAIPNRASPAPSSQSHDHTDVNANSPELEGQFSSLMSLVVSLPLECWMLDFMVESDRPAERRFPCIRRVFRRHSSNQHKPPFSHPLHLIGCPCRSIISLVKAGRPCHFIILA